MSATTHEVASEPRRGDVLCAVRARTGRSDEVAIITVVELGARPDRTGISDVGVVVARIAGPPTDTTIALREWASLVLGTGRDDGNYTVTVLRRGDP